MDPMGKGSLQLLAQESTLRSKQASNHWSQIPRRALGRVQLSGFSSNKKIHEQKLVGGFPMVNNG